MPGGGGEAAAGGVKRSLSIAGHRTSVSLEAPFWDALRDIAEGKVVGDTTTLADAGSAASAASAMAWCSMRALSSSKGEIR